MPRTLSIKNTPVPIYMTTEVVNVIKYLCSRINKIEWSAIIFYEPVGSIKNLKKFSINVKKIYPMHKGDGAFTEYEFADKDFIKFRMANMEVNFMKIGHMHSHHGMAVFFSGTDNDEIVENSENHNYYLSIIVNNFNEITAKIAMRTSVKTAKYFGKDEEGVEFSLMNKGEMETIVTFLDCEVKSYLPEIPEYVVKRTEQILSNSTAWEIEKKKREAAAKPITGFGHAGAGNYGRTNEYYHDRYPAQPQSRSVIVHEPKGYIQKFPASGVFEIETPIIFPEEEETQEEKDYVVFIDNLAFKVLLLGDHQLILDKGFVETEQAVKYIIHEHGTDILGYGMKMIDSYSRVYKESAKEIDEVSFLDDLEEVRDYLAEYEEDYPYMSVIVSLLDDFYSKCEVEFEKTEV